MLLGRRFKTLLFITALIIIILAIVIYIYFDKYPFGYPTKRITIPEGYNIYQIDRLLVDNEILAISGSLVALRADEFSEYWFLAENDTLEGFLFPDTYYFFKGSSPQIIARRFLDNWSRRASPLFISKRHVSEKVIVASLIEEEVLNDARERALVAGIIFKRLQKNMPLQIDATLCYIRNRFGCGRVIPSDKTLDSPYNTYKHRGLPPGPISSPGLSALKAAIYPQSSEYLFFISDPRTGNKIFAKTLDEHNQNIVKYLR